MHYQLVKSIFEVVGCKTKVGKPSPGISAAIRSEKSKMDTLLEFFGD